MSVPTFVIGTGRCGSTMLSNMLREHPHVLSLSEFYTMISDFDPLRLPKIFPPDAVDGQTFWAFVAGIAPFVSFVLQQRVAPPEILYPCDSPSARFSRATGVPAILLTTLPHLTDDHDALFDALGHEVNSWPVATMDEHYRHLFRWLAERLHKRIWIERSGAVTFMLAQQLVAKFPDARFIHMVRDGRDVALSMREHIGFRIGVVMNLIGQYLGTHPIESSDRTNIESVPRELRPFLPENFKTDAFAEFRLPVQVCGEYWSQEIGNGSSVVSTLPADRLLTLRYEDFFVDAKKQLDALTAFLGNEFVDEEWSTRCAAAVRKPRSTWRDLPEETKRVLTDACRPGFEQLRAAGVHYDV